MKIKILIGVIVVIVLALLSVFFWREYQTRFSPEAVKAVDAAKAAELKKEADAKQAARDKEVIKNMAPINPVRDYDQYTAAQIAKHNTQKSCWVVVDGKVYDATSYMNAYPDGKDLILPYCGKDGTAAFNSKGFGAGTSDNAKKELASLFVGELAN